MRLPFENTISALIIVKLMLINYYIGLNNIGDEGLKKLSKMKFENLTRLDLSLNNIGDEGKKLISEMKNKNPNLNILDQ